MLEFWNVEKPAGNDGVAEVWNGWNDGRLHVPVKRETRAGIGIWNAIRGAIFPLLGLTRD